MKRLPAGLFLAIASLVVACATEPPIPKGFTDLHMAAREGKTEQVISLIANGAGVNTASPVNGVTPLHLASLKGHAEIVHRLLTAGANANAVAITGDTPLMFASSGGHTTIVKDLLSHGASVNALSGEKYGDHTALISATESGQVETVQVLLDAGADPNLRTVHNRTTALISAAYLGHRDIVLLLINRGADIRASSSEGFTACASAAENGHQDIVTLLKTRSQAMGVEIACPATAQDTT